MAAQGGHGHDPVFLACAVCDYGGGLLCAYGVMAALFARQRTGRGQLVETSLLQAAMAVQSGELIYYDGRPDMENGGPDLLGRHPLRRVYRCVDGWIFVAGDTVNRAGPALSSSKGESRSVFGVEIRTPETMGESADGPTAAALEAQFASRSGAAVLTELAAARLPAARVLNVAELFQDSQVIANNLIHEATVEPWGAFRQTGTLVKYSATPVTIQRPAARLGEHTDEILRSLLGYSSEKVEALRAAGVVV